MFYGDRSGGVKDPSGNSWFIATHKEDVDAQELQKRAEAFVKQQKNKGSVSVSILVDTSSGRNHTGGCPLPSAIVVTPSAA